MAVEINGHEISGFLLMLDLAKSSQAGLDLPGWIPLTRFPLLDAESTAGRLGVPLYSKKRISTPKPKNERRAKKQGRAWTAKAEAGNLL